MRLGITSNIFGAGHLDESFRLSAETSAEGIEVCYDDFNDAKALGRSDHAEKLNTLAKENHLEIVSLALGFLDREPSLIGKPENVARSQEHIGKALRTAADVGAGIVLVPFFGKNMIEIEDEVQTASEALLELVEQAERSGVVLGVASTLNYNQQQFLLDYLGRTGSVKIYYNTGNALARKLGVATGIRDLGRDAIAQVHFKDAKMVEGVPPDFNVALGDGDVDFQAVVQSLRAVGYDGWIILDTPPLDDPVAGAKANLDWARKLL